MEVGKEWVSNEQQATGKQVTSDPLEKNKTRNTSRPWWVALEILKELENCLKKLYSGVSRKRRNWATQQKAKINKLELGSQVKITWQNLLRDHFEEAMRTFSSASPLMANPFVRTAGQLMFACILVGIELETLTSHDKLKLGGKNLEVYQTLMQHIARDNSGLCLARRRDTTCFFEVDKVGDDRQYHPSMSTKSNRKSDSGKENISSHLKCIPEFWDRKGGWFQAVSREPQKVRRDTEILQQEV